MVNEKDQIYNMMGKSDGHHVTLVLENKWRLHGYVDVFETRFDNQDEEDPEIRGKGTVCFFPDGTCGMLITEDDITSIIVDD